MTFFRRWSLQFAFICATLFITFLGATTSQAQTFRGTILGTVTDSTGAALVGATVTVHNVDTGSGPHHGDYLGRRLPDARAARWATYNVTFSMKGFQKSATTGCHGDGGRPSGGWTLR